MFNKMLKEKMKENGMTIAELSREIGQSSQNICNKLARDNFSENDMRIIAEALNCTLDIKLVRNDPNIES